MGDIPHFEAHISLYNSKNGQLLVGFREHLFAKNLVQLIESDNITVDTNDKFDNFKISRSVFIYNNESQILMLFYDGTKMFVLTPSVQKMFYNWFKVPLEMWNLVMVRRE